MAFEFYGDEAEAAVLAGAGVDVADLTEEMQKSVNRWINAKLKMEGFVVSDEVTEYHSVDESGITELMLENCPVVALVLTDDANATIPVVVNASAYYIDLNTGIIQLLINKALTGSDIITEFVVGVNSVKVVYTYGYESIPSDIIQLATLVLAKWGKINNQQTDADGLKSVKIGDYTEAYDLNFLNINSEFDEQIKGILEYAIEKYGKYV